MSKKIKTNRKPSHEIFHATQTPEGGKAFWTKLGAAWQNEDGSLNLKFNFLPTDLSDGTIQVRIIKEKEKGKK